MPDADDSAEAGLRNDPVQAASALLDAPNRAIIEALQRDGRQPYGAIAEAVGLSEAAVRRRVQRLRESGIMQIVAVTDPLQLGFTRQAMVGISVEGDVAQGGREAVSHAGGRLRRHVRGLVRHSG